MKILILLSLFSSFFLSFPFPSCITENYKTYTKFIHTKGTLYFYTCAFWFKTMYKSQLVSYGPKHASQMYSLRHRVRMNQTAPIIF